MSEIKWYSFRFMGRLRVSSIFVLSYVIQQLFPNGRPK